MPLPGGSAEELRLLAGVRGGCWDPTPSRWARPVVAALSEWRLFQPAAWGSYLSWLASARPVRQTVLVDPSARRAVYTSFVLVSEPHPSGSAESTRATYQLLSYRCELEELGQGLPREGVHHGPPRAAFVLGLALMRSDPSQALGNCRVGSVSPAPAHLDEGCYCVSAAGGTEPES